MGQEITIIQFKRQFTLKLVSLACLMLCQPAAFALGFGDLKVRSNLGEILRLQVSLGGASDDVLVPGCLHPKIETLDGELIDIPRVEFILPSQANMPVLINLVSKKNMVEPALRLSIAMSCGATMQRDYAFLLDFVDSPNAAPAVLVTAAPVNPTVIELPGKVLPARILPKPADPARSADQTVVKVRAAASVTPPKKVFRPGLDGALHDRPNGRDVLKVANEDSSSEFDLKMSPLLTETNKTDPDQQRMQANRQAQAQFAAILRGDDPVVSAQDQLKKEQLKTRALENRVGQLSAEVTVKQQQAQGLSPLVLGLGAAVVALLLALIGLIGFAIRRANHNRDSTWWDATSEQKQKVENIVDLLQPSVDRGNLDPGTITSVNVPQEQPAPTVAAPAEYSVPVGQLRREGLPALEDTNSSTFNFFGSRGQSIHIEEISDITQEAEFWMSVNDPHRAIEILEPQSADEHPQTPITWLYLLDLYRLVGDEVKYGQMRRRFKGKFNARIPEFNEEVIASPVRSFEDFPHMVANCCALWSTNDIGGYLESLLVDNREGDRLGFDLPVYRDILFLLTLSNEVRRFDHGQPLPAGSATGTISPPANKPKKPPETLDFDLLDFKPRSPGDT